MPPEATRAFQVLVVAVITLASSTTAATTLTDFTIHDQIDASGLIVVADVLEVDPEAGDAEEKGPLTHVRFGVDQVLYGASTPETLEFWLPEGHIQQDGEPHFIRIGHAPSFLPGETYLLFIRNGAWVDTPVVGWWRGAYRKVTVGEQDYWVQADGRCVTGSNEQSGLLPGYPIVAPQTILGPVIDGQQVTFTSERIFGEDGDEDEGTGTYHDDSNWEENSWVSNTQFCRDFSDVIEDLQHYISTHNPDPTDVRSVSSRHGLEFPTVEADDSPGSEPALCIEEDTPLLCEGQ